MSAEHDDTIDALHKELHGLEQKLAECQRERDKLKSDLRNNSLVPGEMHCAKCGFHLIRTNLYVNHGTTGPGDNKTEPCPNGCGPLWPETWERSAREAWKRAESLHAERVKAEADRDRLRAAIEIVLADSGVFYDCRISYELIQEMCKALAEVKP